MTREEYAESIKQSVLSIGKQAVMQILIARFPFLGMALINPIVGLIVGYVLQIAIKETELALFFNYVDMRTGEQQNEFEKAALENFRVQKSGTAEEKKNAEKKLVLAFTKFASLKS